MRPEPFILPEVSIPSPRLLYPMLDDRTVSTAEAHPYAGEFLWTADANRFGWTALLGQAPGSDGVPAYAAAARAERLAGLPPTYICAGALDLLLEEDLEYARRLLRAGGPTELHVYPGVYHGFIQVPNAQVSRAATRDYMAALRRALYPGENRPGGAPSLPKKQACTWGSDLIRTRNNAKRAGSERGLLLGRLLECDEDPH